MFKVSVRFDYIACDICFRRLKGVLWIIAIKGVLDRSGRFYLQLLKSHQLSSLSNGHHLLEAFWTAPYLPANDESNPVLSSPLLHLPVHMEALGLGFHLS